MAVSNSHRGSRIALLLVATALVALPCLAARPIRQPVRPPSTRVAPAPASRPAAPSASRPAGPRRPRPTAASIAAAAANLRLETTKHYEIHTDLPAPLADELGKRMD